MSDAPLSKCPNCGREELKRVVSGGAGVIYRGEGWYVTDYSKKSSGGKDDPAKDSKSSKVSDAPKETVGTPKQEAKPAPGPVSPTKPNAD